MVACRATNLMLFESLIIVIAGNTRTCKDFFDFFNDKAVIHIVLVGKMSWTIVLFEIFLLLPIKPTVYLKSRPIPLAPAGNYSSFLFII